MTTVGVGMYDKGKLQGMAMADWGLDTILKSILQIKPAPNSFALFGDKEHDCIIATTESGVNNDEMMGKSLSDVKWYSENLKDGGLLDYDGKKYIREGSDLKEIDI